MRDGEKIFGEGNETELNENEGEQIKKVRKYIEKQYHIHLSSDEEEEISDIIMNQINNKYYQSLSFTNPEDEEVNKQLLNIKVSENCDVDKELIKCKIQSERNNEIEQIKQKQVDDKEEVKIEENENIENEFEKIDLQRQRNILFKMRRLLLPSEIIIKNNDEQIKIMKLSSILDIEPQYLMRYDSLNNQQQSSISKSSKSQQSFQSCSSSIFLENSTNPLNQYEYPILNNSRIIARDNNRHRIISHIQVINKNIAGKENNLKINEFGQIQKDLHNLSSFIVADSDRKVTHMHLNKPLRTGIGEILTQLYEQAQKQMIDNPIMNQPSTLPSSALEKRMFHALTSQAGSTIDVELENYGIEDEAIIIEDQQTYFNDPAVKLLQSEENSNSGFKKNEFDDKDSNQEIIDEDNIYTRKNESGTSTTAILAVGLNNSFTEIQIKQ